MANFDAAFQWAMPHEGGWSDHAADKGGKTNFGLTLALAKHYGIETEEELKAVTLEKVKEIFQAEFWRFDNVKSQQVATILFDIAINSGLHRAVVIAQKAARVCGLILDSDGKWGPATLKAVNQITPSTFIPVLQTERENWYEQIIAGDPSQKVFERGWLKRAHDTPPEELQA